MSSKNTKKSNDIKKTDVLESSVITKKKNNTSTFIYSLIAVIVALILVILFLLNNKCNKNDKCRSVAPIEKELQYQLINYNGYNFRMPLDWSFISDSNNYEITNSKETMYMTLNTIKIAYDEFVTAEFQHDYLEKLQTENNIKINKSSSGETANIKYYFLDGIYNSYNYCVVVVGDEDSVVLISTEFIDKLTYTNLKQVIIDFAVSASKNSKK